MHVDIRIQENLRCYTIVVPSQVDVSLDIVTDLHVRRLPNTSFPMLLAFIRRIPRTKSVVDRTSSRRYSSIDYDCNGFDETSSESFSIETNHRTKSFSDQVKLLDSISHQQNQQLHPLENGSTNGHHHHHHSTDTFDDDPDHDEYDFFARFSLLPHDC